MYQQMAKLEPENPIHAALVNLTEPAKIVQFFDSYVAHCKQHGDTPEVRKNPEAVARINIGYMLGYTNPATTKRWTGSIEGIVNPYSIATPQLGIKQPDASNAGDVALHTLLTGLAIGIEIRRKGYMGKPPLETVIKD